MFLFHVEVFRPVRFTRRRVRQSRVIFMHAMGHFVGRVRFPHFHVADYNGSGVAVPFGIPPRFSYLQRFSFRIFPSGILLWFRDTFRR